MSIEVNSSLQSTAFTSASSSASARDRRSLIDVESVQSNSDAISEHKGDTSFRVYKFHWGLKCVVCQTTQVDYETTLGGRRRGRNILRLRGGDTDDEDSPVEGESLADMDARLERRDRRGVLVGLYGLHITLRFFLFPTYNYIEAVGLVEARKRQRASLVPRLRFGVARASASRTRTPAQSHIAKAGRALGRLVDQQTTAFMRGQPLPCTDQYACRVRPIFERSEKLEEAVAREEAPSGSNEPDEVSSSKNDDDGEGEGSESSVPSVVSGGSDGLTYAVHPDLPKLSGLSKNALSVVHPVAQVFWLSMLASGYKPVDSQVPVGELALKIGTMVDGLWRYERTGAIVLVELKVRNHSPAYTQGTDRLRPPYADKDNCLFHQDQLQLGWSLWLARKSMGGQRISHAALALVNPGAIESSLHFRSDAVRLIPLEGWVLETRRVRALVNEIRQARLQSASKRRAS